MEKTLFISIVAIISGFISRLLLLKVDYRQYPSYPQSYFSHIALGFISACLGAVFLPAFLKGDFTAVTFLTLAASQFREIRSMERDSLLALEEDELVQRGNAYIEDISKRFEARNYLVMSAAFLTSLSMYVLYNYFNKASAVIALIIGLGFTYYASNFMKTHTLKDIATIKIDKIKFDGPLMMVDDLIIMNIGQDSSRKIILDKGIGIMLYFKSQTSMTILSNLGQRQAILHNITTQVGIRKDIDEPDFTPIARRQAETGNIAIVFLPVELSKEKLLKSIKNTPILESAKERPLNFKKLLERNKHE